MDAPGDLLPENSLARRVDLGLFLLLRYRPRERSFFALAIASARILRAMLPMRSTVVPQARRSEARHAR